MRRWLPETAQGQILAILLGALLATFALFPTVMTLDRPAAPPLPPGPWSAALQIAPIVAALQAAPPADRPNIAAAVSTPDLGVSIGPAPACERTAPGRHARDLRRILLGLLGNRSAPPSVAECKGQSGTADAIRIELPKDGISLSVRDSPDVREIVLATLPLTVAIGFALILIVALSLWTLWRINRPLRSLALTVERFGHDVAVAPLPADGPLDVRRVAQAFNRMQERIVRSIEERKRMLMAIGHDLRTPLTRLMLRVEMDETLASRQYLMRDLELMRKMVNGSLAFLDDHGDREAFETVDLGALIESICIEFSEAGKQVSYRGSYGPECRCQPTAMTRAVGNLIENGCRYGTHVAADVRRNGASAVIEISDDGPGIPAAMRETVLAPFVRLDPARAADGGLGLGLSIVHDIVRRHRGELALAAAEPSGLVVRIVLPLDLDAGPAEAPPVPARETSR
jgi:signal transduction histidine kinase